MRTRVKICGLTRPDDAVAAASAGADAIGLVFYEPSPRHVDIASARRIVEAVNPFVTTVGLFVDAEQSWVESVLAAVPLAVLQFHGDEPEDYCRGFGRPYIKALRARPGVDLQAQAQRYPSAAAILVDSYRKGVPGGTGEIFDWDAIPASMRHSIILAGGLSPDNVAGAVAAVEPMAVDVSGGVESSPGEKSAAKIRAFIEAVNRD